MPAFDGQHGVQKGMIDSCRPGNLKSGYGLVDIPILINEDSGLS